MAFLIHLLQELKTKVLLIRVIWVPQIPLLYQVRDWLLVTLFFLFSYQENQMISTSWTCAATSFCGFEQLPPFVDWSGFLLQWIRVTSSFCGLGHLPFQI